MDYDKLWIEHQQLKRKVAELTEFHERWLPLLQRLESAQTAQATGGMVTGAGGGGGGAVTRKRGDRVDVKVVPPGALPGI
jgi:hypothetical protein